MGGGHSLNLLPIVMTLINIVSSAIYLKGLTLRDKLQTYALSLIFLVLLYNSPSGLVLYWTLNNLFALVKNVLLYMCPSPRKVLYRVLSILFFVAGFIVLFFGEKYFSEKKRFFIFEIAQIFALFPLLWQCKALLISDTSIFIKGIVSITKVRKFRITYIAISFLAILISFYIMLKTHYKLHNRFLLCELTQFIAILPLLLRLYYAKKPTITALLSCRKNIYSKEDFALFLSSIIGLCLLCGLLLPVSVIATSPVEFSFIGKVQNPLFYVANTFFIFCGAFILWPLLIYKMFKKRVHSFLPYLMFLCFIMAILNAYCFKFYYGKITHTFALENPAALQVRSKFFTYIPVLIFAIIALSLYIIKNTKAKKYLATLSIALCIGISLLSMTKICKVQTSFAKQLQDKKQAGFLSSEQDIMPVYHLSKNKQNVLILVSDAFIGPVVPYILKEHPELAQIYSGFTYYANTVSHGCYTLKTSPALLGGYEYTPARMNDRADELLKDKHDEAMLVMPRLFSDAGFDISLSNLPYPNYIQYGDLSIFAPYPAWYVNEFRFSMKEQFIRLYLEKMFSEGKLNTQGQKQPNINVAHHIIGFSCMQILPPIVRNIIYNNGQYLQDTQVDFNIETADDIDFAQRVAQQEGWGGSDYELTTLWGFSQVYYVPQLTDCKVKDNGSFVLIWTDLTHILGPTMILEQPDYVPSMKIDISKANAGSFQADNLWYIGEYHQLAAFMMQTARLLEKLKEMGCYDNTRIIITSDHGHKISGLFSNMPYPQDITTYSPLLMVKDFNAIGDIKTDNTFMTNADVPLIAKKDLAISDINPFTGKSLTEQVEKSLVTCYPSQFQEGYNEWKADERRTIKLWKLDHFSAPGNADSAYTIHDNIYEPNNWHRLKDDE